MEQPQRTELETVLSMALQKQSRRNAELMMDLDLAHSQIEVMKAEVKVTEGKVSAE